MSPDVVWGGFVGMVLLGFTVLETYGIVSKADGDTLSERFRSWFNTDDRSAGAWTFVTIIIGFAAWFVPHIIYGG